MTDRHFKRPFSPTGTLSPARRIVNRLTIYSSPAVSPGILPFAASDFPQSARRHEHKLSSPIDSGQNQSAFKYQAA